MKFLKIYKHLNNFKRFNFSTSLNKEKINKIGEKTIIEGSQINVAPQISSELPKEKNKYSILFFGNDEISLNTFLKLYEEKYKEDSIIKDINVITTPLEQKKSTQGLFHKFLIDKNIKKTELNVKSEEGLKQSWREINEMLKMGSYNLGLVASFGKMIPGSIITSLKYGMFVMHPSLLPKYRGAAPIQHTLLNKDEVAGVSIITTSIGKFDAGEIIMQKEIPVEPFYRFKELSYHLSNLGGEMLVEFLNDYQNKIIAKKAQIPTEVTKASLIKDSKFVLLDFCEDPAVNLIRIYNAFYGSQLEPFAIASLSGKEKLIFFENLFLVTESSGHFKNFLNKITNVKPGSIVWDIKHDKNAIFIKSNTNWLMTTSLKIEGYPYTPAEKVISKIFMNKPFKDKKKTEYENFILQKNK
jgi:methionyl-tRNA formyltransferase